MKTKNRTIYLVAGAISMLCAGIVYAWSILKLPFSQDFGWSATELAFNFTLTMIFTCLGGVLSGQMSTRMKPGNIVLTGTILAAVGFFACSCIQGESVWTLYLCYGMCAGLGIGMVYNAILSSVSAWFPDKRGTCSGVLMMSYGGSALLLGNLCSNGFQSIGWRMTFRVIGVGLGIVLFLVSRIVCLPDKTEEKKEQLLHVTNYTTGEMLQTGVFWRFFLYSILLSAVGNTVISCARDVAVSGLGAGENLAVNLVGVLSVANGLGRILCGVLFDRKGARKTMLISGIITIFAPAVTLVAVLQQNVILGIIGLVFTGLSYGTAPATNSSVIGYFFGPKYFSRNFSMINMNLILASLIATWAASLYVSTGSFIVPYILLLVLSMGSMLLNLTIKKPK
ncbi:MAG: MFS transporter [Lachnospiraceae bacterium]|nr:MFS transporter [Lachnospiraceae bacterium]